MPDCFVSVELTVAVVEVDEVNTQTPTAVLPGSPLSIRYPSTQKSILRALLSPALRAELCHIPPSACRGDEKDGREEDGEIAHVAHTTIWCANQQEA